ncbi:MAG: response regulator [Rhodospirillaceae bacterium]
MADILVAEDNSAVRMAYRMLLNNVGHTITEAVDGTDAVAKLSAGRFDLIVTDLWMPGIDGFGVIAEAKRRHPATPVLALTGGALSTGAQDPGIRARAAGADLVIEKPMLGDGLLAPINALLAGAAA